MQLKIFQLLSSLIFASIVMTGCTWVEVTEAGYKVAVISPEEAANCERLGETRAEVLDNVGPIPRSEEKVQEELIALAKNSAGEMGGNAIVPEGNPLVGAQRFSIYNCN